MHPRLSRVVALGVAGLFTAFWLWFGIASAMAEQLGATNAALHVLVPGGIFLATLVVAWRQEALGGALLVLEGLAVAVGYPWLFRSRVAVSTVVLVLVTMALPPVVAGGLLLANWWRARGCRSSSGQTG